MFKPVGAFSGFSVDDLAKAKEFYAEKLGLQIKDDEMGLQLQLPGGAQVFMYPKDNHEPATYTTLNLVVENIDDALGELEKRGVKFEHYNSKDLPQDDKGVLRGLSNDMGPDIAWFKDPAGNVLSILQHK